MSQIVPLEETWLENLDVARLEGVRNSHETSKMTKDAL